MPRKRYKPAEIVAKLRQVDVLVSQGSSVADAIRQTGVSEVTFYRWRQEFARRRACIEPVRESLGVSERRVCAAFGPHRSTQRKIPRGRADTARLTADIIELARHYVRADDPRVNVPDQ